MKKWMNEKKIYIWSILFLLLIFMIFIVASWSQKQYFRFLTPEWLLLYVIGNHVLSSHPYSVYFTTILAGVLVFFESKKENKKRWKICANISG